MNNEEISRIIYELYKKSNSCKKVEDYLDLAFNFEFNGFRIAPLQDKDEILSLLKIISKIKPKTIVEIGTAGGGTLFLLCKIAPYDARIISVDLPDGKFGGELFSDWKIPIYRSFVKKDQKIELIRSNSHEEKTVNNIKRLLKDEKIDLLIIDGDHEYEGIKKDFQMYYPMIKEDGMIVLHDINDQCNEDVEVFKFWEKIKNKYQSAELVFNQNGLGFGFGIIIKNTKNKSENYMHVLKELNNTKNQKIKKLLDNPLSSILSLYENRIDLQNNFPEVKLGNYDNLINWASNNFLDNNSKEKDANRYLSDFSQWYSEFVELQKSKENYSNLEKTIDVKDNIIKNLEKLTAEREAYAKDLETTLKIKNTTVTNLENMIIKKDEKVSELEKLATENERIAKEFENLASEREAYAKDLETTLKIKNTTVTNLENMIIKKEGEIVSELEKLATENERIAKEFENLASEREGRVSELEKLATEHINNLGESIKNKEYQLIELRNQLFEIENSYIYHIMKKISKNIDSALPNNSRRGELKKIIQASLLLISQRGFSEYLSAVKTKLRKGEFRVLEQLQLSEEDENLLLETVKKNSGTRLKLNPHNKKEITNDEFKILESDEFI